jgi:hypothetical protein
LPPRRARSTGSSGPTAPASRRRSARSSGSCAPTPAPRGCSAATRGATRSPSTAGSPTCLATSTSGPTSPAARRSTCSAGCAGLDPKRRDALIERFELDPRKKGGTYSKGNRQKVALVAALAADVELLILDEPTSGLDPLMEEAFRECVEERRAAGTTVLLSSHILSEVEALGDRVTIIHAGRAVETGTLADLRHLTRTSIVAETERPPTGLAALAGVHDLHVQGVRARFDVDTSHPDEALRRLAAFGVRSLTSRPPTLEELFLRHYGDDLAAAGNGAGG